MNNPGNNIRRSLLKSQEALNKFKARKEAFLIEKKQILKELEEAKNIWESTVKQLPNQDFN
jgi:hypothetical protein